MGLTMRMREKLGVALAMSLGAMYAFPNTLTLKFERR
jgi:hypothetical protein